MFLGTYQHALDTKGRVSIPARYRELLAAEADPGLILTIHSGDAGQCLVVYPRAPFNRLAETLVTDGPMDPRLERYARAILPTATEAAPDRQGRILLPATLRELVGIQRDVTWVGMWSRMEIWDGVRWEASHRADLAEVGNLNKLYTELTTKHRE
jgi:MraZ protein